MSVVRVVWSLGHQDPVQVSHMPVEMFLLIRTVFTHGAGKGFFARVDGHVTLQAVLALGALKHLAADPA